jgi:NADH-quinone oxidoreductase subunit J
MELAVFYVAAVVAVATGVLAVAHRNPVVNVMSLVVTFFCVAVCYALLAAPFLAAAQILVYAGAILVLFLFVVMLLNAPLPTTDQPRKAQRIVGAAAVALVGLGGAALALLVAPAPRAPVAEGTAAAIGRLLVGPHLFAFELVSVLLLAALVGAMVLVKRKA